MVKILQTYYLGFIVAAIWAVILATQIYAAMLTKRSNRDFHTFIDSREGMDKAQMELNRETLEAIKMLNERVTRLERRLGLAPMEEPGSGLSIN